LCLKKIKIAPFFKTKNADLLGSSDTSGDLNVAFSNVDNSDAAFVQIINKTYPEVLHNLWNNLNPREIALIGKNIK